MSANIRQILVSICINLGPVLSCQLHRLLSIDTTVCTACDATHAEFISLTRATHLRALSIPALASVGSAEITLRSPNPRRTLGRETLLILGGSEIRPVERGKALLGVPHTLLRRSITVVGVRDKVGTMRRALVSHDVCSCHYLQILVLS